MANSYWIDISVALTDDFVHWPGDPDVKIRQVKEREKDGSNSTKIEMMAHTGTHIDAPRHFMNDGATIDQMPLSTMIGRAKVIHIQDPNVIKKGELQRHNISKGDRILFRTKNSDRRWDELPFLEKFVYLETDAAEYLAETGVRLVGIDYLSVSGYKMNDEEVHNALLGAGIWIIEGLDLSQAEEGDYNMICMPVKIKGSDGAPARVAIKRASEEKDLENMVRFD